MNTQENAENTREFIIRKEVKEHDIAYDDTELSPKDRRAIKKMLGHFYNLEALEAAHYKYQVSPKWGDELNHLLLLSFANEMTHTQDFGVRSLERTRASSILTGFYSLAGAFIGYYIRLRSKAPMCRINIFLEEAAISEYKKMLETMSLDDKTRAMMEHNMRDEIEHRDRFAAALEKI